MAVTRPRDENADLPKDYGAWRDHFPVKRRRDRTSAVADKTTERGGDGAPSSKHDQTEIIASLCCVSSTPVSRGNSYSPKQAMLEHVQEEASVGFEAQHPTTQVESAHSRDGFVFWAAGKRLCPVPWTSVDGNFRPVSSSPGHVASPGHNHCDSSFVHAVRLHCQRHLSPTIGSTFPHPTCVRMHSRSHQIEREFSQV